MDTDKHRLKRFATVCSGIGAPEVAADPLGWECVFSSDIEAFPNAVRKHHWPSVPNLGDMTRFREWPERCACEHYEPGPAIKLKLSGIKIKIYVCKHCRGIRIDVLIGGTPCQSFSVAGLRRGLADPRGNLALVFLGIIERYRPQWVLWENVPGVHSSWSDVAAHPAAEVFCADIEAARRACRAAGLDLGTVCGSGDFEEVDQSNDFDCFIAGLEELGYGTAMRILDAQYFGVAQRRRRVFVVGHIGGLWQRAAAVLFERESLRGDPAPSRETRQRIAPTISGGAPFSRTGNSRVEADAITEVAPTISARANGGGGLGTDFDCDGGRISTVTEDGFQPQTPITLAIRGRGDSSDLETRQDGTANAILTPNGGRGGVGVGAVAVEEPIAFDTAQITSKANRTKAEPGLPASTLNQHGQMHVALPSGNDARPVMMRGREGCAGGGKGPLLSPEQSLTLAANANDQVLFQEVPDVAPTMDQRSGRSGDNSFATSGGLVPEISPSVSSKWHKHSGGPSGDECQNMVPTTGMAVRRLTPLECERLQGFPDNFTAINFRGKPACDGPRYKALGNSMAVPNIRWLLKRMDLIDKISPYKP